MEWINFNKLIREEFTKDARKPGNLYVSDIGRCLRKTYYEYFHPMENEEFVGRFAVGDMMHSKITEILSHTYEYVSSERDIVIVIPDLGMRISGRFDDIVFHDGDSILVEKKSTSNLFFVNKPNFSDLIQTYLYMFAKGLSKAQIVYTEKNSFDAKAFNIEFDESFFNDVVMPRVKTISNCIKNKLLPEAEAKQGSSWQCKYCKHVDKCNYNRNI